MYKTVQYHITQCMHYARTQLVHQGIGKIKNIALITEAPKQKLLTSRQDSDKVGELETRSRI